MLPEQKALTHRENPRSCTGRYSVVNDIDYAKVWPGKLWTSPVALEGSNGNRIEKGEGGVESRNYQIHPECGE